MCGNTQYALTKPTAANNSFTCVHVNNMLYGFSRDERKQLSNLTSSRSEPTHRGLLAAQRRGASQMDRHYHQHRPIMLHPAFGGRCVLGASTIRQLLLLLLRSDGDQTRTRVQFVSPSLPLTLAAVMCVTSDCTPCINCSNIESLSAVLLEDQHTTCSVQTQQ